MQRLQLAKKQFDKTEHYLYNHYDDKNITIYLNFLLYDDISELTCIISIYYYDYLVCHEDLRYIETEINVDDFDKDIQFNCVKEAIKYFRSEINIHLSYTIINFNEKINKIKKLFKDTLRDQCLYKSIFEKIPIDNTLEHIKKERDFLESEINLIIDINKFDLFKSLLNEPEINLYNTICENNNFIKEPTCIEDIEHMNKDGIFNYLNMIGRDIF